jgi:hypothetical protein
LRTARRSLWVSSFRNAMNRFTSAAGSLALARKQLVRGLDFHRASKHV